MQLLRVCACAFAAEGLGVRMFVYDIVAVAAQAGARDLHRSRCAAIESHFTLARHACITHPHNFIAPPVSQCTQQAACRFHSGCARRLFRRCPQENARCTHTGPGATKTAVLV